MKYFKQCKSEDEARTTFTELSKKHHPDAGGNADTFASIKTEYDEWKVLFKHGAAPTQLQKTPQKAKPKVKQEKPHKEKPPEIPIQADNSILKPLAQVFGGLEKAFKGLSVLMD